MSTKIEKETEQVLFIAYNGKRPFTVITTKASYDVEWCKRDQTLYYYDSGSGGGELIITDHNDVFWAAPEVTFGRYNAATRKTEPEPTHRGRRFKKPLWKARFERALENGCADDIMEGRCEYCPECEDFLPSKDTNNLCEHCFWCDESADWSKPGERCTWDCEECIEENREREPRPPILLIAAGHAIVANRLASRVQYLLSKHGLNPETFAERYYSGCSDAAAAVRAALEGRVHEDAVDYEIYEVAEHLGLDEAEAVDLVNLFHETENDQ